LRTDDDDNVRVSKVATEFSGGFVDAMATRGSMGLTLENAVCDGISPASNLCPRGGVQIVTRLVKQDGWTTEETDLPQPQEWGGTATAYITKLSYVGRAPHLVKKKVSFGMNLILLANGIRNKKMQPGWADWTLFEPNAPATRTSSNADEVLEELEDEHAIEELMDEPAAPDDQRPVAVEAVEPVTEGEAGEVREAHGNLVPAVHRTGAVAGPRDDGRNPGAVAAAPDVGDAPEQ